MTINIGISLGLVGLAFGTTAFANSFKNPDLQNLQREIQKKHLNWQVGESWVTRLPNPELQNMLGLRTLPKGHLDFEAAHPMSTAAKRDWRNYKGVNWLGRVMNQGNCGSCVAFSSVATLEAQTSITAGAPWLHPSFSPQELFSCGGGVCKAGWMPEDAANFLQMNGIVDEACMPYTSGSTSLDAPCSERCQDSEVRATRISGYNTPTSNGGSIDAVKNALNKGPLVTTLEVYTDFLAYAGGIYEHVSGRSMGGHAVSLVGYDEAKRAWLIRNSWGKEWGEKGFAWISWDDVSGIGASTWAFEVPAPGGLVVNNPIDREYISGSYRLAGRSQTAKENTSQFRIYDNRGVEVLALPCTYTNGQNCTAQLKTADLKEGRYQIVLENSSAYSQQSQMREFYVINSEPKLTLSLEPAETTDLNRPIQGKAEFLIHASFSPVPIQSLEVRVLDQDGKIVSVKGNQYILEEMKMAWRADGVPAGNYKILVHGETHYQGKTYSVNSNSFDITIGRPAAASVLAK